MNPTQSWTRSQQGLIGQGKILSQTQDVVDLDRVGRTESETANVLRQLPKRCEFVEGHKARNAAILSNDYQRQSWMETER